MKVVTSIWLLFVCLSCSNTSSKSNLGSSQKTTPFYNIYNLDTLKYLIKKDTNEIKKLHFPKNVYLRDTTFFAEDDSSWHSFVCYNETQILLIMETSLECPNFIQRIGVLNGSVVGLKPVHVGSIFKDIKPYVSHTIPSYPDGYFGLRDNTDGNITYFFDIGDNYDLAIGNVKFENIPEDLVISQILIE
jgi:hypothetical protein